jgi:hypothetical protein
MSSLIFYDLFLPQVMGFGDDVTRFCALARRHLTRPVSTCARKQRAQRLRWAKDVMGAILGVDVALNLCEVIKMLPIYVLFPLPPSYTPPTSPNHEGWQHLRGKRCPRPSRGGLSNNVIFQLQESEEYARIIM